MSYVPASELESYTSMEHSIPEKHKKKEQLCQNVPWDAKNEENIFQLG